MKVQSLYTLSWPNDCNEVVDGSGGWWPPFTNMTKFSIERFWAKTKKVNVIKLYILSAIIILSTTHYIAHSDHFTMWTLIYIYYCWFSDYLVDIWLANINAKIRELRVIKESFGDNYKIKKNIITAWVLIFEPFFFTGYLYKSPCS